MKKAIVAILLIICMATLFAATTVTQTITLISVVEEVRPHFSLEAKNITNGFILSNNSAEVMVEAFDIKKDVSAEFNILQSFSNFKGSAEIDITVSELHYDEFHTKGMKLSGEVNETDGRIGYSIISGNIIKLYLDYSGKYIDDSVAAEISIKYNGDSNLPNGEYVSYVTMSYVVK